MSSMDWEDWTPEQVAEGLRALGAGQVRTGLPMADWTPVRIGGPVDVFVEPGTVQDLERGVRYLASRRVRTRVVGRGRHLLVHDGGVDGVVISTSRLTGLHLTEAGTVELEAGASLETLATLAEEAGLTVPPFLRGVDGSLGWALAGRTGLPTDLWLPHLESLHLLTPAGRRMVVGKEKWEETGTLPGLHDKVLVSAVVRLDRAARRSRGSWSAPRLEGAALGPLFHPLPQRRRRLLASVPELIARSGLAGVRINGARISREAPDWIENTGKASAWDVITLIKLIRDRIKRDHRVVLQPAVDVVGRPARRRPVLPWADERLAGGGETHLGTAA